MQVKKRHMNVSVQERASGAVGFSNLVPSATILLPEQAKLARSIMRMVLPIRQFYLVLAGRGSCQVGLVQFRKPQVVRPTKP